MGITIQRHVGTSSATSTSHSFSVQVDAGTNRGLLAFLSTGKAGSSSLPSAVQYGGVSMALVGEMTIGLYGYVSAYYLSAPAVGTASVTTTVSVSTGCRLTAWVLDGVHQSTAPTYVEGTNGSTVVWSWTSTVNALIAVVAKRSDIATWTAGGGVTESSNATVDQAGGSLTDRVAAGYLIADATSEAPSYTLSGGESGSNIYGSVQWLEAAGATTAFRPYYITG